MVRPIAERLLSRLWRCCSIGLIATAALAQLVLLDPGEPATAALLPAEAMEECLRAALASPLALLPRAPPRSLDAALLDAALQAARDEAAPDDTTVVLTFVDSHMLDWLLNWLVHVRAARIPHVVGAMDAPTLNVLAHCGVHAFSGGGGDMGSDWGAVERGKAEVVDAALRHGVDVLLSDVDVVWLSDPRPLLRRWPDADVLVSTDALAPLSEGGGVLEPHAAWDLPEGATAGLANVGLVLLRPRSARQV